MTTPLTEPMTTLTLVPEASKTPPPKRTCEEADALARGQATLYLLGQRATRRLTRRELAAYEAAKAGQRVVGDTEAANVYYRWCEGAQRPWVCVCREGRYARVSMDLLFLQQS
jgi:hypothetical protein